VVSLVAASHLCTQLCCCVQCHACVQQALRLSACARVMQMRAFLLNRACSDDQPCLCALCCYLCLHFTPRQSDAGLVPTLKTIGAVPSVSLYGVLGYVPDTFKVDPSPTKCLYRAKCPTNINSFTLEGTVSVSHSGPKLEKESLYELAGRSWFPKHPVKFVCTFKTDQMSGPAQC
jgi:hypothetical protein